MPAKTTCRHGLGQRRATVGAREGAGQEVSARRHGKKACVEAYLLISELSREQAPAARMTDSRTSVAATW